MKKLYFLITLFTATSIFSAPAELDDWVDIDKSYNPELQRSRALNATFKEPKSLEMPTDLKNQKLTITQSTAKEPTTSSWKSLTKFVTDPFLVTDAQKLRNKFTAHASNGTNQSLGLSEAEKATFQAMPQAEKQKIIDQWLAAHKQTFSEKLNQTNQQDRANFSNMNSINKGHKDLAEKYYTAKDEKSANEQEAKILDNRKNFDAERTDKLKNLIQSYEQKIKDFQDNLKNQTGTTTSNSKNEQPIAKIDFNDPLLDETTDDFFLEAIDNRSNLSTKLNTPESKPTIAKTNLFAETNTDFLDLGLKKDTVPTQEIFDQAVLNRSNSPFWKKQFKSRAQTLAQEFNLTIPQKQEPATGDGDDAFHNLLAQFMPKKN